MSLTGGRGADVVITACPAPEAQVTALKVAAMNGRVLFFGGLPADRAVVGLDTNLVHYRQLIVTGTTRQSLSQYRAVLRLIEDGLLRVDDLVSARWPVESIREGFAAVMRGSGLKHAVTFEEAEGSHESGTPDRGGHRNPGHQGGALRSVWSVPGRGLRALGTASSRPPGRWRRTRSARLSSVQRTIRRCVEASSTAAGGVAAVAIDGQMAGIIGVGADGRAVTPYDSWLDTRCAPYIERMEKEAGEEVMRKTGGPPSFNHGPKILWWQSERPRCSAASAASCSPAGTRPCACAG